MAMKGRGGAVGGAAVWPVYEDFKPNSEWQQDAHSHNLIISIPGFMREQLRVSTEGRNIIRVRGERLIAGNKWSRFLEDFEVPENSDMNSVRAKFHEGALTITIPKKTIDKPHELTPEKKGIEARQDEKQRQVEDRSKEASSSKTKLTGAERAEAELDKTVAKEERNSERRKELGKDETATGKIKSEMDDRVAGKDKGNEGKRNEVNETSGAEHGAFTKAVKGLAAKDKGKEGKEKEAIESSGAEHGAFTKAVKGLAAKDKGKEGKKKEVIESSGAEDGAFTKAVKGLAELNEERKLMVNMGVAVLVIVSFSAYITYKFVAGDDKK